MEQKELLDKDHQVISQGLKLRFSPMTVASASGCWLTDLSGKEYLDLTAGWAVANIGYGREEIAKTIFDQYLKLSFTTQLSAPSETMVQLAEKLISLTPGDFEKKVWFGHSGSDANELISKFIPIAAGRSKMISFIGSYHGQTMGASSLSGHSAQARFEGRGNVVKIPYPNPYRPFSGISDNLTEQTLHYMKEVFATICPADDTAGIIIEAIQSDGGMILPPPAFLQALREICDQYGIYLIIDEVKVGMGRTGAWFSFQHCEIVPDVVVLGKSLGAGLPISAVVGRKELLDAVSAGHMFTTSGNPVSTSAALKNIQLIEEEGLLENAKHQGISFLNGLHKLQETYPCIGDVRGKGLAIGVEIVENRHSQNPDPLKTAAICYRAYELGLLIYNVGIYGNVLEITPPLTINALEVERALAILEEVFKDAENGHIDLHKVQEFSGWG